MLAFKWLSTGSLLPFTLQLIVILRERLARARSGMFKS